MSSPVLAIECPHDDELARFCRGDLSGARLEEIALHLESCGRCLASLDEVSRASDDLLFELRRLPGSGGRAESDFSQEIAELEAKSSVFFSSTLEESLATAAEELPPRLGEYAIHAILGRGGMGTVYRAIHTRLDKVVALKLLSPQRLGDASAMARFAREMRAVGKLSHPNIVSATDAGEFAGAPYLVMEYVEGIDLARLVKRSGPLTVADACEIVRQAALGLQYAHDRALVHRDIKPSNLLLTLDPDQPSGGLVKVADMGLALVCDPDGDQGGMTTSTNLVIGSLDYMAPEQADDAHHVDQRADLYSLGCTLHELLTGKPPFADARHQTRLQKLKAHAAAPMPSLAAACPNLPAGLEPLVQRLLAKRPADRFATASELATAIHPYCAGANLRILLDNASESSPRQPPVASAPRWKRRKTKGIVLGCFGALLAAAIIYIQTDRGTVEITSDDEDVEVRVEQKGKLITILDRKQNKQVRLRSGVYEVKLGEPDADLALNSSGFTLSRGGKEIVTVKRHVPAALRSPFSVEEAQRQQARWARYLGAESRLKGSLDIELSLIPPGEFLLHPGYHVRLTKAYYLGAREVTMGQFRQFVEATGHQSDVEASGRGAILQNVDGAFPETPGVNWRNAHSEAGDDHPVTCITYADAESFCTWLSKREKKTYRLPTEAEWVWACRAGSQARFPSGEDEKAVDAFDWHNANSGRKPHPVGRLKPNAWGLYDMNGNAVEWCRDWHLNDLPQAFATDPGGPAQAEIRVLRGGSFIDGPFESTSRGCFGPRQTMIHIGFRVCREL